MNRTMDPLYKPDQNADNYDEKNVNDHEWDDAKLLEEFK